MKFHEQRTVIKSPLNSIIDYRQAIRAGALRGVPVQMADADEVPGVWRRMSVREINARDTQNREPLEVKGANVAPRKAIVDELTRHQSTFQFFVPLTGSMMMVVAPSSDREANQPDPSRISMVPVRVGQAIEVCRGTWHTLPFVFAESVLWLSIMHRDSLDGYHDVRDLAAAGWIGFLEWIDPA